MVQIIEGYLNHFTDFLWEQFEQDLAMSEKAMQFIDRAVASLHAFFTPKD